MHKGLLIAVMKKVHFSFYRIDSDYPSEVACGMGPPLRLYRTSDDRKVTCLRCRATRIFRDWVHR